MNRKIDTKVEIQIATMEFQCVLDVAVLNSEDLGILLNLTSQKGLR